MAKKFSLLWITTVSLVSLVIISSGLILFLSLGLAQKNTSKLISDKASLIVSSVTGRIVNTLSPVEHQLAFIEDRIKQGQVDLNSEGQIMASLHLALSGSEDIATLIYVSPDKHATLVSQATQAALFTESIDWQDMPFIDELINQVRPKWLAPVFVGDIGQTVITYSRPVYIENRYKGVLLATVHIAKLSEHFKALASKYNATPFILYGKDKILVSNAAPASEIKSSESYPNSINWASNLVSIENSTDPVLKQMWSENSTRAITKKIPQGFKARLLRQDGMLDDFLFYYQEIDKYGEVPWLLGCYFNDDSFASDLDLIEKVLYLCLMILLIAIVFAVWFSRVLSRPVLDLSDAAQKVYRQNFAKIPELKGSPIIEFNQAARSFNHMVSGLKEKKRMQENFNKYVPKVMAREILSKGMIEPQTKLTTTLFTDIAGFSSISEQMTPEAVIDFLNQYFAAMIVPIEKYNGVIHQFQGDAILATFNLPKDDEHHAFNAVSAAVEMVNISRAKAYGDHHGVYTRIGINTGDAVCGTIGGESRLGITVHGDQVNLAARIEQLNKQFETQILVSASTYHLTSELFNYRYIGEVPVRGRIESVTVYTL